MARESPCRRPTAVGRGPVRRSRRLVIRGAVYRVDLGDARRGHEQRGRRYGLVLSPTDMAWTVATIVPTSTQAQPAVFRPEIELGGVPTRFLVDQLRSIDVRFMDGEPAYSPHRDEIEGVGAAVPGSLGLCPAARPHRLSRHHPPAVAWLARAGGPPGAWGAGSD